jgi:very-short-patch-repair endonuclease
MSMRNCNRGKTPLDPPLSGGKLARSSGIHSTDESAKATPPLTRGGREGLGFILYNKKLTDFARENRKHPTLAESKLWYLLLRMKNFSGYKFTRQKPIANFIVDFYCAELRLAIEIDGDSHAESRSYDLQRTVVLNKLGISIVRYSNDEVLNNLDGVYDDLASKVIRLKEHDGGAQ